jgi:ribosomal protein S19
MEAQTQTKLGDKVKELRKQNRKLINELLEAKAQLDKYKQDVNILTRHVVMLENIVLDLINIHYGNKVKADFTKLELCVDQRCIGFSEYEEFLVALRILPLLIQ